MKAIILAGGKGTRLYPYSAVFPKPLVPVGDYPILEIIVRQLKQCGINEIIMSTGHLAELIEAYFRGGERWGVRIAYVREHKSLGTAGCLQLIPDNNDEDYLVMNGDILTTLDFKKLFRFHRKQKASATIATFKRKVKIDLGVLSIDRNKELNDYIEKPTYRFVVSMGVYVLHSSAKEYIRKDEYLEMPRLILRMKKDGRKVVCFSDRYHWLDIGRPDDYALAQNRFQQQKNKYLKHAK